MIDKPVIRIRIFGITLLLHEHFQFPSQWYYWKYFCKCGLNIWYWEQVWFWTIIIIWLLMKDSSFLFVMSSHSTIESFSDPITSFNTFFFFCSQETRKHYADTLKSFSVQCIVQTLNQSNHHWHYFFIFIPLQLVTVVMNL